MAGNNAWILVLYLALIAWLLVGCANCQNHQTICGGPYLSIF